MDCQIGSLTYTYASYLQNGRKEADSLFCKLSWLVAAQPVIDSYIPVGTLISDPGEDACGLTNTVIGFAPVPPPPLTFQITLLDYNGNPIVVGGTFSTVLLAMAAIVAALTTASGVQWSYMQISDFEFELCAPYTQNGDFVNIFIEVFQEGSLGFLTMGVTMAGGIAPAAPVYQTDADNCNITASQHEIMVETASWVTKGVRCCDIPKPLPVVCDSNNPTGANIELRESLDEELREQGN